MAKEINNNCNDNLGKYQPVDSNEMVIILQTTKHLNS